MLVAMRGVSKAFSDTSAYSKDLSGQNLHFRLIALSNAACQASNSTYMSVMPQEQVMHSVL